MITLSRKHILLLFAFVMLVACQKESFRTQSPSLFPAIGETTAETKGFESDFSISKEMILSFIKSNPKHNNIVSIAGYPSEENPTMYVVNFEEGWTIYPTDSRFGLTLAANPYEHLDLNDKSHNMGFQLMIESYNEQIAHFRGIPMEDYDKSSALFWDLFREKRSKENPLPPKKNEANTRWDGMPWAIVEAGTSTSDSTLMLRWHLIGDEWGQESPWNVRMPLIGYKHCVTGCAPLAVAQVLHYFNATPNPTGLYHSISEVSRTYYSNNYDYDCLSISLQRSDYTASSPRWSQMSYSSSIGTTVGFEYASDLILDVGVRLGTRYGLKGSGVSINPTNNYFDLSPINLSFSWSAYSYGLIDTLIMNISTYKPVIITAAKSSDYYARHTWIIDGIYSCRTYYQNDYALWPVTMIPEGATIVDFMPESQVALQYPDYYPGMVFHERNWYVDNTYYYMNFGDDGQRKWDYYSCYASASWDGYDVIKAVHYNLSPGDLLIQ